MVILKIGLSIIISIMDFSNKMDIIIDNVIILKRMNKMKFRDIDTCYYVK